MPTNQPRDWYKEVLEIALALGIAYEPCTGPCGPGELKDILAEIKRLKDFYTNHIESNLWVHSELFK